MSLKLKGNKSYVNFYSKVPIVGKQIAVDSLTIKLKPYLKISKECSIFVNNIEIKIPKGVRSLDSFIKLVNHNLEVENAVSWEMLDNNKIKLNSKAHLHLDSSLSTDFGIPYKTHYILKGNKPVDNITEVCLYIPEKVHLSVGCKTNNKEFEIKKGIYTLDLLNEQLKDNSIKNIYNLNVTKDKKLEFSSNVGIFLHGNLPQYLGFKESQILEYPEIPLNTNVTVVGKELPNYFDGEIMQIQGKINLPNINSHEIDSIVPLVPLEKAITLDKYANLKLYFIEGKAALESDKYFELNEKMMKSLNIDQPRDFSVTSTVNFQNYEDFFFEIHCDKICKTLSLRSTNNNEHLEEGILHTFYIVKNKGNFLCESLKFVPTITNSNKREINILFKEVNHNFIDPVAEFCLYLAVT